MMERTVPRPSRQQTFAAFKYRNYRLWFGGQLVSLFGTWMQTTAQGYLVYQLTNSPAYLGYVACASGLPTWLFTLYGGVVADRMSRRTLMVITQSAMLVLAFILAALAFTGLVQPWHIVVLAFLLGIANAFDAPARQAFVLELVEREDLTNAIALNATMFNGATAVGPAAAGVTYAALGPGWCFTLNGVSFIAVIVALLMMRITPQAVPARRVSAAGDLMEGLRYVVAHPIIRALIGLVGVLSLFGVSLFTLLPAWAIEVLGGDAATLGWLQSARGAGALIGALLLASLGRFEFKGKLLTVGTFLFPLMLLIFALVRWLPASLLVLVAGGSAQVLALNLANAIVQTHVSDELRGRVMGIYSLVFFGFMPIGGLLAGAAAQYIGEPETVVVSALILLGVAVLVWVFLPKVWALR
jgi:MFS family permease